jgi:vacuolar-type H+-ATPase subunit C/Vma6
MPDYDYGNARLHVMKSKLLSKRDLELLAEGGSLQGLIAALIKTVYQKAVEEALTRATGMECIDEALRNDLVNTVGKVGTFYRGSAGKLVGIILESYEIQNLKAILRGLAKNVPAGDILAVLLPVGQLNLGTMRDLARLSSPREAIDLLASRGLPFAGPLLNVRAESPGAETFEMELALDRWHYQRARQILRDESGTEDPLHGALDLDADLANTLTVLRFAHDPHERDLLRERFGTDKLEHLFVGPGRIPLGLLAEACKKDTVSDAVEALAKTYLGPALMTGLDIYTRSNRLSDIERQLRHFRLEWMARQFTRDPLDIGVVLGYVALKANEIGNLRWITHGINLGLRPAVILSDLETVS